MNFYSLLIPLHASLSSSSSSSSSSPLAHNLPLTPSKKNWIAIIHFWEFVFVLLRLSTDPPTHSTPSYSWSVLLTIAWFFLRFWGTWAVLAAPETVWNRCFCCYSRLFGRLYFYLLGHLPSSKNVCYSRFSLSMSMLSILTRAGLMWRLLSEYADNALRSFKQGIFEDPLYKLSDWNQNDEDPCYWTGIFCSASKDHVINM